MQNARSRDLEVNESDWPRISIEFVDEDGKINEYLCLEKLENERQ